MIEFGGNIYYIDVEALENTIKLEHNVNKEDVVEIKEVTYTDVKTGVQTHKVTKKISERSREIDATKYDILRLMIEILMDSSEDTEDDSLGAERALDKTSLGYKIAFNTLLNYGILKEKE
jgi:hypothetical protein